MPAVASPVRSRSPSSLLSIEDLSDPRQFVTVPRVPILDVHDDDEHGRVDLALLRLLAKNTNGLVARGDPPAVALGHLKSKQTVCVEKKGVRRCVLGASESDQPEVVGYA